MASYNPAAELAITEEKEMFFRLCNLIIDGGTRVMRIEFDRIHPPNSLHLVLQKEKHKLLKLRGALTPAMRDILFPSSTAHVSSKNFDMSLLSVLFRNICNLTPPTSSNPNIPKSWDIYPVPSDTSLAADLVRLKLSRNLIIAHASETSISKQEFCKIWKEISNILSRRGGPTWQKHVDKLLNTPFTPLGKACLKQLKAWHQLENDLVEIATETSKQVEEMKVEASKKAEEMKDDMQDMKGSFLEMKSDVQEIKFALVEIKNKQNSSDRK